MSEDAPAQAAVAPSKRCCAQAPTTPAKSAAPATKAGWAAPVVYSMRAHEKWLTMAMREAGRCLLRVPPGPYAMFAV